MGNFSQINFWKLKKSMIPRVEEVPISKRDSDGNRVTTDLALKNLYLKTYKDRLSPAKMEVDYEEIYELKDRLWNSMNENFSKVKSEPWTMDDLEKSLKKLKSNKARDPHGLANELFKEGDIGQDLKMALLKFYNLIKDNMEIPELITYADITSIYKKQRV